MRVAVIGLSLLVAAASRGTSATADAGMTIRVLTYNIHHGEGVDKKIDLDRIAKVIAESNADVVCLQEIDRNLPRTGKADFPALLHEKTNMAVVFEPNYRFDGGEYGNATLTKHEVVSQKNIVLPSAGNEPRGCLVTTVRINGVLVDVMNTHLGLDAEQRKEQAAAILSIPREDRPAVLAGDLNENPSGGGVQLLLTRFKDSASGDEAGTIGKGVRRRKIDFVLVSGDVDVLSSCVLTTPLTAVASDHLPFMTELRVPAGQGRAADEGVHTDDDRFEKAIDEGT